ncbi:kinase-like protein [Ramicandelaber brevisporus]|nr:kinase-like protein [Ramicandelaber brevisporus]
MESSSNNSNSSNSNNNGSASASAATMELPQKDGLLTIRVIEARGLVFPPGSQQILARYSQFQSDSQRLPYLVLEFDKNEVVVNALGGDPSNPTWRSRTSFDVCRADSVLVSLYQRTPAAFIDQRFLQTSTSPRTRAQHLHEQLLQRDQQLHGSNGSGAQQTQQQQQGQGQGTAISQQQSLMHGQNNTSSAIFLGAARVNPAFEDNKMSDQWYPLLNGSGHIRVQVFYSRREQAPLTVDAFDLLTVIGKGSFGKVMQVRKKDTGRIYAMKILSKSKLVMRSEVAHTLAERIVLAQINHPFIVPLKFSFQSTEKLYLVLAFVNGGELFRHLQNEIRFDEHRARFYAAELLTALECLHSYNIVYRDIKPENILIDFTGHIALCDFGLCKLNMRENDTTRTFCGTPEYLAPELILSLPYTKQVDWWTFGVLLYEMLTGLPPFYDENTNIMYRKIVEDELVFPDYVGLRARSLLAGLLVRDPNQRLGILGASQIKSHPFFDEINWDMLLAKKYDPPFKPSVASAIDTSNFDEEFTSEMPLDSLPVEGQSALLSSTVQQQFAGFTYEGDGGAMSLAQSHGPMSFSDRMRHHP